VDDERENNSLVLCVRPRSWVEDSQEGEGDRAFVTMIIEGEDEEVMKLRVECVVRDGIGGERLVRVAVFLGVVFIENSRWVCPSRGGKHGT